MSLARPCSGIFCSYVLASELQPGRIKLGATAMAEIYGLFSGRDSRVRYVGETGGLDITF